MNWHNTFATSMFISNTREAYYSLKDDNFRKELDELIYNIKDGEKICGNTVKNG